MERQLHSRDFPQAPLCTVARDSVADLFGAGKADPRWQIVTAGPDLQNKAGGRHARGARGTQEVRALFYDAQTLRPRRRNAILNAIYVRRIHLRRGHGHAHLKSRRLSAQRFPATGTAVVQDFTARFCRHARAETVTPFAYEIAGLIGAFHGTCSILSVGRTESRRLGLCSRPVTYLPYSPKSNPSKGKTPVYDSLFTQISP